MNEETLICNPDDKGKLTGILFGQISKEEKYSVRLGAIGQTPIKVSIFVRWIAHQIADIRISFVCS